MAENYNLNSTFGLNVTKGGSIVNPKKTKEEAEQSDKIFDAMTNYVKKYEDVFDGSVAKEINMYTRQAMIIGMNLKASDNTKRHFDVNI